MAAQVAQSRPAGQRLADAVCRGGREQRLSAMAGSHHALDPRQRQRRRIFVAVRLDCPGMQAHPHAHGADIAPAFLVQRALRAQRGSQRIAGLFERRAESVAQDLEHVAPVSAYRALQQRVMAG